MAIGISVLVAASTGRGAMARQTLYNKVMLLDESAHNNIKYSLQNLSDDNSLGAGIIWALYDAKADDNKMLGDIIITDAYFDNGMDILNVDDVCIGNITIHFSLQDVRVTPSRAAVLIISEDWDGTGPVIWDELEPGIPETVTISGVIIVTVEIGIPDADSVTSQAEYVLTGDSGVLIENADEELELNISAVRWELVRRSEMIGSIR
jgi:hypothetical protein